MKKHFIVKRDDTFGNIGLIEKGAPITFNALSGQGIAHDCLEHFKGDTGSLDDEFQALGCAIWIRVDTCYLRDEDILAEMIMLYGYFLEGHPCKPAPNDFIISGNKSSIIEWVAENIQSFLYTEYQGDIDLSNIDHFIRSWAYWSEIGYFRAKKKYNYPNQTLSVFKEIESKVDNFLKYVDYEGQELFIKYFPNDYSKPVIIDEIHDYNDY